MKRCACASRRCASKGASLAWQHTASSVTKSLRTRRTPHYHGHIIASSTDLGCQARREGCFTARCCQKWRPCRSRRGQATPFAPTGGQPSFEAATGTLIALHLLFVPSSGSCSQLRPGTTDGVKPRRGIHYLHSHKSFAGGNFLIRKGCFPKMVSFHSI